MKWVTRERPKIDRIACPWLISRFIDPEPEFLYVPSGRVLAVAEETGATPYDIPDVELGHVGEKCSFDAFVEKYGIQDPAVRQMALMVRGADTSRLDLTPQSRGLYAISLGLSALFEDDQEMLRHGMGIYDALYAWCRDRQEIKRQEACLQPEQKDAAQEASEESFPASGFQLFSLSERAVARDEDSPARRDGSRHLIVSPDFRRTGRIPASQRR